MKSYVIYASQMVYWRKEIEANSKEEAEAIAFDESNRDWHDYDYGEWAIDAIDELEEITK